MYCRNCGKELVDGSNFCPHCGCNVHDSQTNNVSQQQTTVHNISQNTNNSASVVVIHGYDEHFAVNPSVSVYKDGVYVGEVSRHGTLNVSIKKNCTLKFTCSIRSATVSITKGQDTHVLLSFDRFSGSLKAVKSGESNLNQVAQQKEKESSNATTMSIVFIAVFFILYLIIKVAFL